MTYTRYHTHTTILYPTPQNRKKNMATCTSIPTRDTQQFLKDLAARLSEATGVEVVPVEDASLGVLTLFRYTGSLRDLDPKDMTRLVTGVTKYAKLHYAVPIDIDVDVDAEGPGALASIVVDSDAANMSRVEFMSAYPKLANLARGHESFKRFNVLPFKVPFATIPPAAAAVVSEAFENDPGIKAFFIDPDDEFAEPPKSPMVYTEECRKLDQSDVPSVPCVSSVARSIQPSKVLVNTFIYQCWTQLIRKKAPDLRRQALLQASQLSPPLTESKTI